MIYIYHIDKDRAAIQAQMTRYFNEIIADKKETERELKRLQRKVEKP